MDENVDDSTSEEDHKVNISGVQNDFKDEKQLKDRNEAATIALSTGSCSVDGRSNKTDTDQRTVQQTNTNEISQDEAHALCENNAELTDKNVHGSVEHEEQNNQDTREIINQGNTSDQNRKINNEEASETQCALNEDFEDSPSVGSKDNLIVSPQDNKETIESKYPTLEENSIKTCDWPNCVKQNLDSEDPSSETLCTEPVPSISDDDLGAASGRQKVESETLRRALEGWCTLNNLPPQSKKVVRIFVSSTFSDTKEERNAFMEHVYPKLAHICRSKYGLEFQVMDMRWGVPEQASENHSTTELCLQEIIKCQEVSAGPNFVTILGNKYGYRPMPSQIPQREFELLKSAAEADSDVRWSTVDDWYQLDSNNVPAIYVLQPISKMLSYYNNDENTELHKNALNEWKKIDQTLTHCLRDTSKKAFDSGIIDEEQKHRYYMSVTENEVIHGVFQNKVSPNESCLCIIREIPDIMSHLDERKSPKFIDLNWDDNTVDTAAVEFAKKLRDIKITSIMPEVNVTKVDIGWKASGASISLEDITSKKVVHSEAATFPDGENIAKHKIYIDSLCSVFLSKLTTLISDAGQKQEKIYDELNTEILQHWHFAKARCEVFEGRQDIIDGVKRYISTKTTHPMIIFGRSGCGKTSVMAKIVELIVNTINTKGQPPKKPFRLCFRFLGTTPLTSSIQQVLLSVCKQLSQVCEYPWTEPSKYPDLIKSFHKLLTEASKKFRVILMLDSIDQLLPTYGAYRMNWMPDKLPHNIKFIVSALDEGYNIVDTLRDKYCDTSYRKHEFIEVQPLEEDTGLLIIQKWLAKYCRTMSSSHERVIREALGVCGLPLFARIMFDHVHKWKSYEQYTMHQLETTVNGAINKLYEQMEATFGVIFVKHALSYITCSRFGLSEVELEHIMSLDDNLLNTVFNYWRPPIRRIPPLLWTRVRGEINSYVVERSAGDVLVLCWYHRQFIVATKERYLTECSFTSYIHTIMMEYFCGIWGGGKLKPFLYTEAQVKRFGLATPKSEEDRKVPLQPYIFAGDSTSQGRTRYNQRMVLELPFHLLNNENFDELKKLVFFNLEWLLAKIKCSTAQSLLQELDIFMSHKKIGLDKSYQILYSTLQRVQPCILEYPNSLPYELSGRLAMHIKNDAMIRYLVKTCDTVGTKYCPIVPMLTCFESAQLGLKQSLTITQSEPWHEGGTMCCTDDYETMYVILYDESTNAYLSTWDVEGGEESQRVPIIKPKNNGVVDVYFHCLLHYERKYLVAQYKQKYFRAMLQQLRDQYTNFRYVDIIDVGNGQVLRTIEHLLLGRHYANSMSYMKGDWIAIRYGNKLPLMHLFELKTHRHNRPHMLSDDCQFFLSSCSKKADVRFFVGNEQKKGSTRTKSVQIRKFSNDTTKYPCVGVFEDSDHIDGMAFTKDGQYVILGSSSGEIKIYRIDHLGEGKVIKAKRTLTIPRTERIKVKEGLECEVAEDSDTEEDESDDEDVKTKVILRYTLIISNDDQLAMSIHQGPKGWEAFLWNISRIRGHFIGRVTDIVPITVKHPVFSYDSQFIIMALDSEVRVIASKDAACIHTYRLNGDVRDFYVSMCTNEVVVMLGTEIIFMNIEQHFCDTTLNHSDKEKVQENVTELILDRERLASNRIAHTIRLRDPSDKVTTVEVTDAANEISSRVISAHDSDKNKHISLDVIYSPDGKKIVELFSKTQIVDIANEKICYSPYKGDILFRDPSMQSEQDHMFSGVAGCNIELHATPFLPMTLGTGDKVVGGNGRVRFRVPETNAELKMINVPSYILARSVENGREVQLFGISVYEESLATMSGSYLVTSRRRRGDHFVAVYSMDKGTHLTTHAITEGVSTIAILPDDSKLLVATKKLKMHIFCGKDFLVEQGKCVISSNSESEQYSVNEFVTFTKADDVVLIRFTQDIGASVGDHTYVHVNTTTKKVSPPLVQRIPLEDVSCDGELGS